MGPTPSKCAFALSSDSGVVQAQPGPGKQGGHGQGALPDQERMGELLRFFRALISCIHCRI